MATSPSGGFATLSGSTSASSTQGLFIPIAILEDNLLSTNPSDTGGNSEAWFCYTKQGFSANLQAFLINYVITISGLQASYS